MTETRNQLSTARHWDQERAAGYNNLGWVKAQGPLDKIAELADLTGNEIVVDAGTGSQVVLNRLSEALVAKMGSGIAIGFDVSKGMLLSRDEPLSPNTRLLVADFYNTPFPTGSVDVMTARQVLHNLPNINNAILEARRVLRDGGKFIGVEYVAIDGEVLGFERAVFDLKEPGRNLWTGDQFRDLVFNSWSDAAKNGTKPAQVNVHYYNLKKYSVLNWMENSGLPKETQQEIVNLYRNAPKNIVEKMKVICDGDDVFTDRLFAYIVAIK